jgi:hypothetical protein
MDFMVTEKAASELAKILGTMTPPSGWVLRLDHDGSGALKLEIGEKREGDWIVRHDGEEIMAIPERVGSALADVTLDYKAPPDGPGFTLD